MARTAALRPIAIGEILDRAIDLSVRNFPALAGIAAVYAVPLLALNVRNGHPVSVNTELAVRLGLVERIPIFNIENSALAFSIALGVEFILGPLVGVALVSSISSSYLGKRASFVGAYRTAATRLLTILGLSLVYDLLMFVASLINDEVSVLRHHAPITERIAFLPFTLAGYVVMSSIWFVGGLTACAIALEAASAPGAILITLRRFGTPRRIARLFSSFIVASLVWIGSAFIGGFLWSFLQSHHVTNRLAIAALTTLPVIVAWILITAFVVIFYFDIRVREEAFDLHAAVDAIEQRRASGATI